MAPVGFRVQSHTSSYYGRPEKSYHFLFAGMARSYTSVGMQR